MIDILIGVVILLSVTVAFLFLVVSELKKTIIEIEKKQQFQNEEIVVLMRNHLKHQSMLLEQTEIIKYLIEQDPLLGEDKNKMFYPVIIGEA